MEDKVLTLLDCPWTALLTHGRTQRWDRQPGSFHFSPRVEVFPGCFLHFSVWCFRLTEANKQQVSIISSCVDHYCTVPSPVCRPGPWEDGEGPWHNLEKRWLVFSSSWGSVSSDLEQERCSSRDRPWDLPTQPSPSGLRVMPGGQMHMKVPIRFLHIMPRDSQSCSPSAHSSRSRRHLLRYVSKGEKKITAHCV